MRCMFFRRTRGRSIVVRGLLHGHVPQRHTLALGYLSAILENNVTEERRDLTLCFGLSGGILVVTAYHVRI